MNIKLTRPLCFLDIESATPGPTPDPARDKIVHLYMRWIRAVGIPDDDCMWLFNPGFQMSPHNIECHGITNKMAAGYPMMQSSHASNIAASLKGCDIAGFNHMNYDIPLLWEECYRVGVELNLDGSHFIDAGTIMKKKEERSLSAAVKFYCGREHTGAHDCREDVKGTICVLDAQLLRYPDLGKMTVPELAAFSRHEERLDLAGKIVKGQDGRPVYNFGKSKGVAIEDDPGFAYWMLGKDFSENTKRVLRKLLDLSESPQSQAGLF